MKYVEKLVENIQNNPTNIAAAIRLTSRQTKTSVSTITNHYYKKMRRLTPLFVVMTSKGISINSKNSKVLKETKRTLKLDTKINDLKEMTIEEKASFFDLLLG